MRKPHMLSQVIKKARGAKTMAAFAEEVGVTESCVSQWESGAKRPRFDRLEKIAKLRRMTVVELLAG